MSAAPTTVVGVGAAKPLAVMRDAETTTVSVESADAAFCALALEASAATRAVAPAVERMRALTRAMPRLSIRTSKCISRSPRFIVIDPLRRVVFCGRNAPSTLKTDRDALSPMRKIQIQRCCDATGRTNVELKI